jgi:hypothetical protein
MWLIDSFRNKDKSPDNGISGSGLESMKIYFSILRSEGKVVGFKLSAGIGSRGEEFIRAFRNALKEKGEKGERKGKMFIRKDRIEFRILAMPIPKVVPFVLRESDAQALWKLFEDKNNVGKLVNLGWDKDEFNMYGFKFFIRPRPETKPQ